MIRSFKHKGLGVLFETGSKRGVNPQHAARLARMLDRLDASGSPQDMNLPGWRLHSLAGARAGQWAISVSGNWRLVFEFEGSDAVRVDLEDYH